MGPPQRRPRTQTVLPEPDGGKSLFNDGALGSALSPSTLRLPEAPRASSAKVNSVPCDQARFVGREVRDDARDIVWARDVDQIVTLRHVPSNFVGHPSCIGHRWMDDIGT